MNLEVVANHYLPLVEEMDRALIDRSRHHELNFSKLSGLFIPSIPENYSSAKNKIMVVGRETREWNVLKKSEPFNGTEQYVMAALKKHQSLQRFFLDQKVNDQGFSFFNLVRKIGLQCGTDGLIWANLFCFDWGGANPIRSPLFPIIKQHSERLLKLQIQIFQPKIIIFASGVKTAKLRGQFFPYKGKNSVCTFMGDFSLKDIPNNQLWQFRLYDQIQCYRIQHPSSVSSKSQTARKFLLGLLPPA